MSKKKIKPVSKGKSKSKSKPEKKQKTQAQIKKEVQRKKVNKIVTVTRAKITIQHHRKGYFKGKYTSNEIKALQKISPVLDNKTLSKKIGLSESTLSKMKNNKHVSRESLKKLSKYVNGLSSSKQILIALLTEKYFKGVKNPDIKKLKERIKKNLKKLKKSISEDIDNIELKIWY